MGWFRVTAVLAVVVGGLSLVQPVPGAVAAPRALVWTPPVTVSTNPSESASQPRLRLANNGQLHLVFVEGAPPNSRIMWASQPPGQPWSAPVAISAEVGAERPRLVVDEQNVVHVAYQAVGQAGKRDIYYRRLVNQTVQNLPPLATTNTDSIAPDIAVDQTGRLHTVLLDDSSGRFNVYYSNRLPADPTAAPEPVGSSASIDALSPKIVVDQQATRHVIWVQPLQAGALSDIWYVQRPANAPTFTAVPQNVANTTTNSTQPELVIDNQGTLHIAWLETVLRSVVAYAKRAPNDFTWSPLAIVADLPVDAQAPDLTVDANRSVHVAFSVAVGAGLSDVLYTARRENDATFSPVETIAAVQPQASAPTIANAGPGQVAVAWAVGPAPTRIVVSLGSDRGAATPVVADLPPWLTFGGGLIALLWLARRRPTINRPN